jgi:hypothetical protein
MMQFLRVQFDGSNGDRVEGPYDLEEAVAVCVDPEDGGCWDSEDEAREALEESYANDEECPIDVGQDQHARFVPIKE